MQDAQVTQTQEAAFEDGPDALFGVFQAVGEDLGFDPFYLRVAFLAGLFFSPTAMIAAYAGLGLLVALSRWLLPARGAAAEQAGGPRGEQAAEQPRPQVEAVEEPGPDLIAA